MSRAPRSARLAGFVHGSAGPRAVISPLACSGGQSSMFGVAALWPKRKCLVEGGNHMYEIEFGIKKIKIDLIEPNKVKECLEKGLKK